MLVEHNVNNSEDIKQMKLTTHEEVYLLARAAVNGGQLYRDTFDFNAYSDNSEISFIAVTLDVSSLDAFMRTVQPPVALWRVREYLRSITSYRAIDRNILRGDDCLINADTRLRIRDRFNADYAHVSDTNPNLVSYTPSEEYGVADRQLICKIGKYIASIAPELSCQVLAEVSANYRLAHGNTELMFADNARDIARVYKHGPNSCMSGNDFECDGYHPSEVYDSPDLKLAYTVRGEDIVSRAVVSTLDNIYSRPYGDLILLEGLLHDAGYVRGSLDGHRIRKIEYSGVYVMPWIDGETSCEGNYSSTPVRDYDGDYLMIDSRGDICADNTSGLSGNIYDCHCGDCGEGINTENDEYTCIDDETVCGSCAENYTWCSYEEVYARHDEVYMYNTRYGQEYCTEGYLSELAEHDGDWYDVNALSQFNLVQVETRNDEVFEMNETVVDYGGDIIHREDAVSVITTLDGDTEYYHHDELQQDCELFGENDSGEYILSELVESEAA